MKTFVLDNTPYQAENQVDGILINPVLPDNFWTEPLENRSEEHLRHWEAMPFIVTDDYQSVNNDAYKHQWFKAFPTGTAYRVYCLDGGAWDRPTNWGEFGTLAQAIEFIAEKYRK